MYMSLCVQLQLFEEQKTATMGHAAADDGFYFPFQARV